MDDTRRPRLAARALWICALLALIAASVLGVALPADQAAAAQPTGGGNFKLISQGGGQVRLEWAGGTGQTAYRLNRITTTGVVVVAPSLASTATNFTDSLGTSINVACYQLEILGTNNAVIGTSDILCVIVNVAGGASPPRNVSIQTNESPIVTIGWQAPAAGNQIGYLVVPLGRNPLAFLPANATQAVDAPGVPTCYIVLTLIPDSAQVPFRIGGFSDIVCAIPGLFTPRPNTPTNTAIPLTATRTNTPQVIVVTATPALSSTVTVTGTVPATVTSGATATGTSTFTPANVVVSKVDNPDPVNPGDNLTYTITVTNLGQSPTGPLFVTDSLPAGLTFQVASANQSFVCNETQNTVACSSPNLPGGQSAVISLLVRADNPCVVVSPVTNVVRAQIGGPPNAQSPSATQQTTINTCVQGTSTPSITRTPTQTGTITPIPPTVTTTATPAVDLVINKLDTPDPVVPPGAEQYTLVIQNTGNVAANNISVTDTLPAGEGTDWNFGSASGESGFVCTFNAGPPATVTCTGGNIGPNGGATISIVLNWLNCGQTYYVNTAWVDPANTISEFNENNNTVQSQTACGAGVATATPLGTATITTTPTRTITTVPTTVPTASLNFLKLDSPDPVVFGGSITYTLRLTNTSSANISGVTIQDQLPPEVTFQVVSSAGGGFICSYIGPSGSPDGIVQCSNGTVAANSTVDIVIVVAVTTCISPIVNTARIITPAVANNVATSSTTVSACNTVTPTATVTQTSTSTPTRTLTPTATVVPTLDINISKTGNATGFGGDTFNYTVTIGVTGAGTATWPAGVLSMRDTLPSGVDFNGTTGVGNVVNSYGAVCTFVAGPPQRVECTGGSIPAGGSGTVTIPVELVGCGPAVNIAEADPNNAITETNEGNNLTNFVTTISCDVAISKTVVGGVTSINTSGGTQSITYNLDLTDVSAGTHIPPTNIVDNLPVGFVVTNVVVLGATSGTCAVTGIPATGQTVTCTNVADRNGSDADVRITVDVPATVPLGDYTNTATISTPGDTNAANDTDSVIVTVFPFDLAVTVTDSQDPAPSGFQYVYTVTVTNTSAGGQTSGGFFVTGGLQLRDTTTGARVGAVDAVTAFADIFSVSSPDAACTFPAVSVFNGAAQRYSCAVGSLAAGDSVTITIVVDANAPEPDGTPDVGLDAVISTNQPPTCSGGGTANACAPESSGGAFTNPAPASMRINNRDFETTDID